MTKISEIIRLHTKEKLSTPEIAKQLGLSASTIYYHLKKSGKCRSRNEAVALLHQQDGPQVDPDWSFFPLTLEKAWLLGLICGDGGISDGYKIIITSCDLDVLEKVNNMFGNRLSYVVDKRTDSYKGIRICSKKLCEELRDICGIVQRKFESLRYPIISKKLEPHFWRGILDSDGSLVMDGAYLTFSVTMASEHFIRKMHESVCKRFFIDMNTNHVNVIKPRKKNWRKQFRLKLKGSACLDFCELIYENGVCGNRKHSTYRNFLT